jgi:hypothetical protein
LFFLQRKRTKMNHSKITRAAGIGIIVTIGVIFFSSSVVATYPNTNFLFRGAGASSQLNHDGTLFISIADSPDAPKNVTHVFINYTSIQVHDITANGARWHSVTQPGTIDLMSVVNESKIQGSVTLPAGTLNIVRFEVTSAIVTVNSSTGDRNFSTTVLGGRIQVTVIGGITIRAGQIANILIDITPKVIQTGVGIFKLVPAATARLSSSAITSVTYTSSSTSKSTPPSATTTNVPRTTSAPPTATTNGASNSPVTTTPPAATTRPTTTTPQVSALAAGAFPLGLGIALAAAAVVAAALMIRRKKGAPGTMPQQSTESKSL